MSVSTTNYKDQATHKDTSTSQSTSYSIRKIKNGDFVGWIGKGIEDFKSSNINSLLYGLLFVVAGAITIWYTRHDPLFVMVIVTGFYLVGPPVAAGLYDISRRIEKGESSSLVHAIAVFGQNFRSLFGLTLILGAIMVAWSGAASLIVSAFYNDSNGFQTLLNGDLSVPFSGVLLIGGIALALIASVISLSFLPLLKNRQMGTITVLAILVLIMLAWVRTMVLAINAFLGNSATINSGWNVMTNDPQFMSFLLVFLSIGLVFAVIAFTISVIAVPMIIHRGVSVKTAILTSIKAVKMNPLPMFLWAAAITGLTALGIGLFFVGLAFTLPIIGHASWHAYRDLVIENES